MLVSRRVAFPFLFEIPASHYIVSQSRHTAHARASTHTRTHKILSGGDSRLPRREQPEKVSVERRIQGCREVFDDHRVAVVAAQNGRRLSCFPLGLHARTWRREPLHPRPPPLGAVKHTIDARKSPTHHFRQLRRRIGRQKPRDVLHRYRRR